MLYIAVNNIRLYCCQYAANSIFIRGWRTNWKIGKITCWENTETSCRLISSGILCTDI